MNDVLVAIENVGNIEVAKLGKGFTWLATTAAGAPMLGFLGTVTGMVKAFFALSNAGSNANISVLSGGIYEALVTTVAGLIVGIIALFAYNYLSARVSHVMNKLEKTKLWNLWTCSTSRFRNNPYRHGSQTSARFTRLIQHGVDDRRDFLAAHIFHGHVDFRIAHGI